MDYVYKFGSALLGYYLHLGTPKSEFQFIPSHGYNKLIPDLVSYITILLLSYFNNKIQNHQKKKWFGAIAGVYIVALIYRGNVWHFYISILCTIVAAIKSPKKYCHTVASIVMFSYIVISRSVYMWTEQATDAMSYYLTLCIAFNILGLAFEVHMNHEKSKNEQIPKDNVISQLKFIDVFHYAFNVSILLLAPYVTYRVYDDMIKLPYCRTVKKKRILAATILKIFILAWITMYMGKYFPLKYVLTSEFANRSFIYKNIYGVIQWASIRMHVYRVFSMSHLQCVTSGLGAYPIQGKNTVSYGPTEDIKYLEKLSDNDLELLTYDFNTVRYVDIIPYESTMTVASALRNWNLGYQYWLSSYLHLYFPQNTKVVYPKNLVKLFMTSLWHGVHAGVWVTVVLCVLHMIVEHVFWEIHQKMPNGVKSTCYGTVMWLLKLYLYACWMMPFFLISFGNIVQFYSTIYYAPLILLAFLYVIRYFLLNSIHTIHVKTQ